MDQFQLAVVSGASLDSFFTPEARVRDKKLIQELQSKPFLKFEFMDYNFAKGLEFTDDSHAELAVNVHWATREQEASRTASLHFVNIDGTWYFGDARFWDVSLVFVVPLLVFAILYGGCVFYMVLDIRRRTWTKPSKRIMWELLSVVPFSIFFYLRRKPWTAQA